ncbi:hypothetical protein [Rhizobium sp. IMFF44]|uniref:hypothetical protein n=1 Tax=Rhizobium sp. IMFF44 TaxID=3342350 RepID=UPI0035BAB16C
MASEFYRTTERQRKSAQATRERRAAAGRPQPVAVDEALSAALRSALRQLKAQGDRTSNTSDVLNAIFDSAIQHLVDVRGLDKKQSSIALSARLVKRRRYTSAS